jgi:hemerythrin-like domain-containing protein
MYMFHDMFRREFPLMPGLVRAVAVGDLERAQIIVEHIGVANAVLHAHHSGEDENVWPLLLERAPTNIAPVVQLMESQHAEIASANSEILDAAAAWSSRATIGTRDALAAMLDQLLSPLYVHLGAEEDSIVPLMETYITAAEWSRIASEGAANIGPQTLLLGFGMVIYDANPEVVDITIKNMPDDVRPVIRQLASEAFAAHCQLVYGTATPPVQHRP